MQIFGLDAYPIFRDIIFTTQGTTFSAKSSAAYTVEVLTGAAGAVAVPLYAGRVVKRPGDTYLTVRLNDIISGALHNKTLSFDNAAGVTQPYVDYEQARLQAGGCVAHGLEAPSPVLRFRLTWKDTATVEPLADVAVSFVAYADAGGNFAPGRPDDRGDYGCALTEPICGLMDFRQWAMLTMLRTYNIQDPQGAVLRGGFFGLYSVTQDGDVGTTASVAMFNGGDGDTFNGPQTFFLPLRGGYPGNPVYNLKNRYQNSGWNPHANDPAVQNRYRWQMYVDDGVEEIVGPNYSPVTGTPWGEENFEACTYAARETCARFCLYYVNSYGGWDWLLILGRAVESDSVEDTQIERRSPSALATGNVRQRGVEVIRATVTKHLELHTHWLTDFQAARMHNLLNSPDVWVHDLERDLIFPAVLTKPGCEFKTYKNQGHKLVSYQIDVDYAVTCERV